MKKVVKITLILPFLLSACNDNIDIQDWFPTEYHKILYIQESGEQEVTLYNTGEDNVYTFTVCKAGSDPSLEAHVRIDVMSQSDVDVKYSNNQGIPYKIIPSETFTYEPSELTFASSDISKKVTVAINPEKLKEIMELPSEVNTRWLLPLVAVSENDSINIDKRDYTLLINDVMTLLAGLKKTGTQIINHDYTSGTFVTSVPFGLLEVTNKWDINATIKVDKNYVKEYNNNNNTNYQIPADGSYSIDENVTLSSNMQNVSINISISDFGNRKSGCFMLPIRIADISRFELSAEANLYAPIVRLLGKRLDRSGWTAEACSEEMTGEGTTGRIMDVLDGNHDNFWHTSWQSGPFCNHPNESHYAVFDTKSEHMFTQVGIIQRNNSDWGLCVQNYEVFISSDKKNWVSAGRCFAERSTDELIADITPMKGRYVKLCFLDSRRSDGQINLSEVYFYGE